MPYMHTYEHVHMILAEFRKCRRVLVDQQQLTCVFLRSIGSVVVRVEVSNVLMFGNYMVMSFQVAEQ